MQNWTVTRIGAAAGVGFIILTLLGDLAAGSTPKFDDPATKISVFFHDHHRAVIASVIPTGVAAALFAVFVAALVLHVRAVGEGSWAVVVFALALPGLGLGVAADALYGSLARIVTGGDQSLVQGLYQLDGFFTEKSFWFSAGAVLAVGIAAWRALPRWYAALSTVASVVIGIGGLGVRRSGFLAPLEAITLIAFLALLIWVLFTSLVLWRAAGQPEGAVVPGTPPA